MQSWLIQKRHRIWRDLIRRSTNSNAARFPKTQKVFPTNCFNFVLSQSQKKVAFENFYTVYMDKKRCVKKFEGLARSKLLGISQTTL